MAISLQSFFQERRTPFLFTLSLLLICFLILFFTDSLSLNPLVRKYSSLRSHFGTPSSSSSSSSPPPPAPSSSSFRPSSRLDLKPSSADSVLSHDLDFSNSSAANFSWKLCGGSLAVDFIPCLDNSKAIKALKSRRHMEHRERHCPSPSPRCLIPLPIGYKVPVPWPKSRDMVSLILCQGLLMILFFFWGFCWFVFSDFFSIFFWNWEFLFCSVLFIYLQGFTLPFIPFFVDRTRIFLASILFVLLENGDDHWLYRKSYCCRFGTIMFLIRSLLNTRKTNIGLLSWTSILTFLEVGHSSRMELITIFTSFRRCFSPLSLRWVLLYMHLYHNLSSLYIFLCHYNFV